MTREFLEYYYGKKELQKLIKNMVSKAKFEKKIPQIIKILKKIMN